VRRNVRRDEQQTIQRKGFQDRFSHSQVAVVNRIKRAAVDSYPLTQTLLAH
jgi:hypothetical protein